ncbi:hypothetical protein CANTEDRAFT_130578, partial [Yamadazyma tenuis ATCC 10573]
MSSHPYRQRVPQSEASVSSGSESSSSQYNTPQNLNLHQFRSHPQSQSIHEIA